MIHDQRTDLGSRRLKGLRKLTASYNNLTSLPESIGECVLLEKIRVVNNHITVSWLKSWGVRQSGCSDPTIPFTPINPMWHRLWAGWNWLVVFSGTVFCLLGQASLGILYYIYYIYIYIYHITAYETIHHIIIYVMQSMWTYHSHFEDLLPHSFGGCS